MKTTLGPIGNDIYPPDGKNNENLKTFKNYMVCYTLNLQYIQNYLVVILLIL